LLKKPKKVKINQKKSANAQIKETCGDMFLANKASKSNVAVKGDNIDLIEVDLVSYDQDLSMCSLGSAPLLER
jgi:hypothetical protein